MLWNSGGGGGGGCMFCVVGEVKIMLSVNEKKNERCYCIWEEFISANQAINRQKKEEERITNEWIPKQQSKICKTQINRPDHQISFQYWNIDTSHIRGINSDLKLSINRSRIFRLFDDDESNNTCWSIWLNFVFSLPVPVNSYQINNISSFF